MVDKISNNKARHGLSSQGVSTKKFERLTGIISCGQLGCKH